jgi:tetratricopeptide (TPR) repeat protein
MKKTNNKLRVGAWNRWPFLILSLLIATATFSQNNQLMEAANAAYTNKNYETAIQHYEQLLSEGYHSEVIHYNLGNAYYRTQKLGRAILHYEKALQFAPTDEDILHNLKVANAQQVDEIEDIPAFFLGQWWKGLRSRLSTGAWTGIALFLLWGSAAGFILWLMAKQRDQRKRGFLVGVILLVLCTLPFLLAIDRNRYDRHSGEAILTAEETQLHFAPDTDSEVVHIIHEGLKVDLQDKISNWYKVRLPNGEVGWLPEEVVEEI